MPIIEQLFIEGDTYLQKAKAEFYLEKEEQCDAICSSCKAIKKYLDAYETFLYRGIKPSENYHVVLHVILQKDPDFRHFIEKIFEVKCFAEESKRKNEEFFLYADEINETLKNVLEIRNYVARKVKLHRKFMEEFTEPSFMST